MAAAAQVTVRFVTSQAAYRVPDTPIAVPVQLRRYGLSEIVNHLLGSTEKPVPFEFLINGEFVRTTLQAFLVARGISTETLVTIEYVESVQPPTEVAGYEHDDWVSAVRSNGAALIATGSYDAHVRVWNEARQVLADLSAHSRPVKSMAWGHAAHPEDGQLLVTGGQDEVVNVWKVHPTTGASEQILTCEGHAASVESVAVSPGSERLVSGDWSGDLKLWRTAAPEDAAPAKGKGDGKRARKTVPTQIAVASFTGHTACISALVWPTAGQVFSASWDHSIREWDASTGLMVASLGAGQPATGLAHSATNQLLASAHEDRLVRVWDPRTKDGVVVKLKLTGHTAWVSSVAWAPSSAHTLASAGYDHTVRVWDMRASAPVFTVAAHSDKVLCLDWSERYLLSGGADRQLKIFRPPAAGAADTVAA